MSTERCRVGALFSGVPHYYQRDTEQKRNGRWVAVPFFVDNPKLAAPMSEAFARHFVVKLQGLGMKNLWLEDCKDGRRIEVENQVPPQSGVDNRPPWATATLDDEHSPDACWYVIRPTNTPNGPKWFLRIDVPGFPEPQVIYEDDPLAVLRRAVDMNILQYAVKHEQPQPQQPAPQNTAPTFRRRPGDNIR
jgi:hypothetical protein